MFLSRKLTPGIIAMARDTHRTAQSAIERHFAEHYEALYRFLRACGASDTAAEDLSQESFLRLHRHLLEKRPEQNVRAWLCRVAYRLWVDRLRQRQRETTAEEFADIHDPSPGPEQELLARERMEWLEAAMRRLSELERKSLHLRADGLTYREIADVLDVGYWRVVEAVGRALDMLGGEAHGL